MISVSYLLNVVSANSQFFAQNPVKENIVFLFFFSLIYRIQNPEESCSCVFLCKSASVLSWYRDRLLLFHQETKALLCLSVNCSHCCGWDSVGMPDSHACKACNLVIFY